MENIIEKVKNRLDDLNVGELELAVWGVTLVGGTMACMNLFDVVRPSTYGIFRKGVSKLGALAVSLYLADKGADVAADFFKKYSSSNETEANTQKEVQDDIAETGQSVEGD